MMEARMKPCVSPHMKKQRPPQGMRIWPRMLVYTICFLAIIASREWLSSGGGPLTHSLGRGMNNIMLASSKLGLGFAMLGKEAGADDTMVGRSSHQLGKLSYRAFVESTKVRLFAR
jgi:hypothetical protein